MEISSPSSELRRRINIQKQRLENYRQTELLQENLSDHEIAEHGFEENGDGSFEEAPNLTAAELYKREMETKSRIKSNWEALIERISKYGEDEQGDVLDINTLEVVEDKGHLKSLAEKHRSHIWHEDFDDEKEKKRLISSKWYLDHKAKIKSPQRDDMILLATRPSASASERLKAKALLLQHSQREQTPEQDHLDFKIPQTPQSQLTSKMDSLSIVTPSSQDKPSITKVVGVPTSRAATLRRLLIQRAKSRSSTPEVSKLKALKPDLEKNIETIKETDSNKKNIDTKTTSHKDIEVQKTSQKVNNFPFDVDAVLQVPLTNKYHYKIPSPEKDAPKTAVELDDLSFKNSTSSPNSDTVLRDILSKVDDNKKYGSLLSEELLERLRNDEERIYLMIDKYERKDKHPKGSIGNRVRSRHNGSFVPLVSLPDEEVSDREGVQVVTAPIQNNMNGIVDLMDAMEISQLQLDPDDALDDLFYSPGKAEKGEQSEEEEENAHEYEIITVVDDDVYDNSFKLRESTPQREISNITKEHQQIEESNPHSKNLQQKLRKEKSRKTEMSLLEGKEKGDEQELGEEEQMLEENGTIETPILVDSDSGSDADFEDSTQRLHLKFSPQRPTNTTPVRKSKDSITKTGPPVVSNNDPFAEASFKAPRAPNLFNEPLGALLKKLSRTGSPQKKVVTPNRSNSSLISTTHSPSHRKISPLRFNLSPLQSRKRHSSSLIPDSPLRKKPSPVKLERRRSSFLMDELSTFEDSD